ncbi:MAG: hypothetical protein Kapaf2KO_06800 [Candidatus Kapaibacteriales bacterium]
MTDKIKSIVSQLRELNQSNNDSNSFIKNAISELEAYMTEYSEGENIDYGSKSTSESHIVTNNIAINTIKDLLNDAKKSDLNASNPIHVIWEGDRYKNHSLSLINREIALRLNQIDGIEYKIKAVSRNDINDNPTRKTNLIEKCKYEQSKDVETPQSGNLLNIRHQWPPNPIPPTEGKWILMQPWEYDKLPEELLPAFMNCDEIWTPSEFSRKSFIKSGVSKDKIQVIPNGFDKEVFSPYGDKYRLNTKASFKFLFVGGAIERKGIDILINAYVNVFKSSDNVCLIIKDHGSDSFYKGNSARKRVLSFLENNDSRQSDLPEIEYIDEELTEEELASLYRACDVFVSPYRGEGFSLPTLEAMACGCVPIVTAGGPTEEFTNAETAFKIPSAIETIEKFSDGYTFSENPKWLTPDINALQSTLLFAVSRPDLLRLMSINGVAKARVSWTWDDMVIRICKRIDKLSGSCNAIKIISMNQHAREKDGFIIFNQIFNRIKNLNILDSEPFEINIEKAKKSIELLESSVKTIKSSADLSDTLKVQMINIFIVTFYYYLIENQQNQELKELLENACKDSLSVSRSIKESQDSMRISLYFERNLDNIDRLERLTEILDASDQEDIIPLSLGTAPPDIMVHSAELLAAENDLEGSRQLYQLALAVEPYRMELYDNIADLYERDGDIENANQIRETIKQ